MDNALTEKKRVEDRRLFETSQDGIMLLDADSGQITDVNPFLSDLIGYSKEELLNKKLWDIGFSKDINKSKNLFLELKNKEYVRYEDLPLETKDGRSIDVEFVSNVYQVDGKKTIQCNVRDITERKRAEEELKSERLFSSLVQHSAIATFVVDPEHKVLNWNKACEELTGVRAEVVIGTSNHWQAFYAKPRPCLADVIVDNETEILDELYEIHVKSKLIPNGLHAEGWYPNLGGKDKYILFDAAPIYGINGKLIAAIETLQDITERKKVEDALKNSEQEKAAVLNGLKKGSVEYLDPQMRIIWVNEAVQESLGISVKEMQGKYCFELIEGLKTPCSGCTAVIACKTGEPQEGELVTPDGKTWISCSNPLKDSMGQVTGVVHVAINITGRKQAEEALRKANDELEMRVKERTEELASKNTEMERFIYAISHDLRTPLISMSGFLGFIEQDAQKGDLERLKNDLRIASDSVSQMDRLLQSTLELSRIGRVISPPEDVPFKGIVGDALGQTEETIESRKVKVSIAPGMPIVHVDKMRIVEVLVNLIENSIKYMGAQEKPEIEIGQRLDGGDSIFFVRDNGIGINPSLHDKVFELFYKVDKKSEGSGAGLAIVKKIIEVHGGRIWIESELGKGCTVCFTLPLAQAI